MDIGGFGEGEHDALATKPLISYCAVVDHFRVLNLMMHHVIPNVRTLKNEHLMDNES